MCLFYSFFVLVFIVWSDVFPATPRFVTGILYLQEARGKDELNIDDDRAANFFNRALGESQR